MILNPFTIVWTNESLEDFSKLAPPIASQVKKGINRVAENPLPQSLGGYGKPLGNKAGLNLTGLFKIKFLKLGIRVVYALREHEGKMVLIVISAREDEKVYRLAAKRRTSL